MLCNKFILDIFVDLSKALHTVAHYIPLWNYTIVELDIQIYNGLKIMSVTGKIEYVSMKIFTKKLGINAVSHKALYLALSNLLRTSIRASGLLDPNTFADGTNSFHSEVSITTCERFSN